MLAQKNFLHKIIHHHEIENIVSIESMIIDSFSYY